MADNNQNNIKPDYIPNVIPQQQTNFNNMSYTDREMRSGYKSTTNLSHGDNIMTTQMTSMVNIQNNYLPHQDRAEYIQQTDFNKFPQHKIPVRETRSDYDINTDLPYENTSTYDASPTDSNLDHHVDYTCNAYSQQQVDLNTEGENNNIVTTQGVPTAEINQNYSENTMPYNNNQDVNTVLQQLIDFLQTN
ncbi:hypothetical protein RclHR1_08500001 [Rhizophagus clarus]|uniref:Uncharacterized protein n=1 Tax=Rhizophagus clarus TaxID=94130 RepID=A0A2Z6S180_9GLOM|nr:hypothetical protein RclHR1_08500001 [Rhizophagus clarus]